MFFLWKNRAHGESMPIHSPTQQRLENDWEAVPGSACETHENQRPFTDNSMLSVSGIVEADGEYGPWMVVARKKSGYKGTKHGLN